MTFSKSNNRTIVKSYIELICSPDILTDERDDMTVEECNLTGPWDLPVDWRIEFEERAAILEYDGGVSREQADERAFAEILNRILEGRFGKRR